MKDRLEKNRSFLLYFSMYWPLGAVCPLIGQYLFKIGFTGTQVGIVISAGTGAAVLGGLFWGKKYANAVNKRFIIVFMFIMAALVALSSLMVKSFILYAVVYGALYFFQGPAHGLCDSMVIENGENFPAIRAMGALGYATSVYAAGLAAEAFGLETIFYIHAAAFVIAAVIMFREKEPPHYDGKEGADGDDDIDIMELFAYKDFIRLLVFAFFLLGSSMAHNTYFGYLYTDGGGDLSGIGLAFLLMAGSEAVFMLFLPKLNSRFSTEKLLVWGMLIAIGRFALYSLGLPSYILLGTFFLQGMMNGIILVEIVKYFEKIVPARLSSLSVAVYYALGSNLSSIVCNLIGGVILDGFGARGVYMFFTLWNLAALGIYFGTGLNKERKGKISAPLEEVLK